MELLDRNTVIKVFPFSIRKDLTVFLLFIIILFLPNFDEVSSLNRKTCRFHVHTLYRCHEYLSGTHPVSRNILSVRSNPSETKKPCYRSNTVTVIRRKKIEG